MFRFLRRILEFIAGFAGVMLMLGLFLIWRLNGGPVTSSFLTPYIETGVDKILPDTQTSIAHTLLTWSSADHSIRLQADGILVKDKENIIIAEVPAVDVEVSAIGAIFGQFLPKKLLVDHPRIRLQRSQDGAIYFGSMTQNGGEFGSGREALARVAHNLAHANITRSLQVRGAVLDVHDETTNRNWAMNIPDIHLTRENGNLIGQAEIEVTQKNETSTLNVHYNFDSASGLHVLQSEFEAITPSFFVGGHPDMLGLAQAGIFDLPISGSVALSFDNDLKIDMVSLDLHGDEGHLIYPVFWDDPRLVKSLTVKGTYDHVHRNLNLQVLAVDFGGPKVNVSITGSPPLFSTHDLDYEMNVMMDNWPMDQYGQLWPKAILPGAREWIVRNMTKGKFDHGEATFKGSMSWNNLANLTVTEGKGRLHASNGRVTYLAGMAAIDGVSADATFDLSQMLVQIQGGGIGTLHLNPFTIKLSGFQDAVQTIDIPIKLAGPVPDVLQLIDSPPLGYARSVGLSPDEISGWVDGTIDLKFPLLTSLRMKDVELKGEAELTDISSSKLIRGLDITQGILAFILDHNGFSIKGPVQINKIPVQVTWQQYFDGANGKPMMQADVTGIVMSDQWKLFGLDGLDGTHGPVAATAQFSRPDKSKMLIHGNLDMLDAEVRVGQLSWTKPSGAPATLKFDAELPDGKNIIVKSIELNGAQIKGVGDAVMSADGSHVLALNMKPLIVGRTNVDLHFTQTIGDEGTLRFEAEGEALDISGIRGSNEPASTDPRAKEFRIKVNKLFTSATGVIAKAEGYAVRDLHGWQEIKLYGLADGDQPIDIGLQPREGRRVFSIACNDFGKALKGFGLTDTVSGGKLDIHGTSSDTNPARIEGKVKIGHLTVSNLPVLAILLNATSPFGFPNLLFGTVDFDRLDGAFRWEGDMLELTEVRMAGTAVGMNVDGKIGIDSGNANLYGMIVPFSMVNRMLNWIPVLGDMLTGGEGGGVLAVAYSVTGTLGEPRVTVNPVSLLTPGFLRNLFFGGSDDSLEDEPDNASPPQFMKPRVAPISSNFNTLH